ncbi:phage shock protein A (PspA) family protein [Amphibacillus marinus]|uniref:Phage shock protein A (PspA) family protein n=1 Tax=Amphibacillus marinus TaxID=872970 RepID=A0A1H8LCY2_9BACI|nr:PspA/IM30 family protein [Amphibacillus marinus]SEO03024.1 phage shock protein A (PspA) family protein [Amphibacillus marinus]
MTNVFTRLKDTIVADFHQLLDQKEEKHPMTHLNQYIRKCEDEVKKLKSLIEKQYVIKQQYQKELSQAKHMLEKREKQVALAERMDEFELLEEAKLEVEQYRARVEQLSEMSGSATKQIEEIETKYGEMQHQLKNLYVKRLELKGRENIARVHKGINQVLQADYLDRSSNKFAEAEDYIERLEQKVRTNYRLHTLDARFAELEKKDTLS